jgi:hypothetical protein
MISRSRCLGSLLTLLLGAGLTGCGDTAPPPPATDKMEGSVEKGKMGGPMESGKMEPGKMESGKMEPGKMEPGKMGGPMESGKMEPGKMEGSPK